MRRSEFSGLFYEVQLAYDRGWRFSQEWRAMPVSDRALFMAYASIEAWRLDEQREREASTRANVEVLTK